MTKLTITPDVVKKRLKVAGSVASGEKVAVTVLGFGAASTDNLRLRVMAGKVAVGVFPLEDGDEWAVDGVNLTCTLNLSTEQASRLCRFGAETCVILEDTATPQLYGVADLQLCPWIKLADVDVPVNLDNYKVKIGILEDEIAQIRDSVGKFGNEIAKANEILDPIRELKGVEVKTNTTNGMRQAIKAIAHALGVLSVKTLALCTLCAGGAEVTTAALGDLDLDTDPRVVTDVTFDGLARTGDVVSKRGDVMPGYYYGDIVLRPASNNAPALVNVGGHGNSGNVRITGGEKRVERVDGDGWMTWREFDVKPEIEIDGLPVRQTLLSLSDGAAAVKDRLDAVTNGLDAVASGLDEHAANTGNPHNVTAEQAGAAPTQRVAQVESNVSSMWYTLYGESCWLAVTNYMRTIPGVMPSFSLWEVRDGATNEVYSSRDEVTNRVEAAVGPLRESVADALEKAELAKAWGRHQSADGSAAPAGYTVVSTTNLVLTGGGKWEGVVLEALGQTFWVFSGAGGLASTPEGKLRCVDANGDTAFEVTTGTMQTLPAIPASFQVESTADGKDVTFSVYATNAPTLWSATDLLGPWFAHSNATWTAGLSNTYTVAMTVDSTSPTMFFRATYELGQQPCVKFAKPLELTRIKIGETIYDVSVSDGKLALTEAN